MADGFCHELVDNVESSTLAEPWHGSKMIAAKIDKEATERSSVIHLILEEDDIIALYQGLMNGLRESSRKVDEANCVLSKLNLDASFGMLSQNKLSESLTEVYSLTR